LRSPAPPHRVPSSLAELLALPPDQLAALDIARVNLLCAQGLPGAEDLNISACLATLDHWTHAVKRYARDGMPDYQRDPDAYHRHPGFFRFLCMASLLKHPRGIGIAYQPTARGNFNFADSRDDLLHGLLTRKLGTCTSLPVLFVAIGRRLGWPMHLAIAKYHVLCQWVDAGGRRINLEGSCGGGGSTFPDEYFHTWPRRLTPYELASGRYLRPLTPPEELALFFETRGHCLVDNRRFDEARHAYEHALRLAPGWSQADYHLHMIDVQRAGIGPRGTPPPTSWLGRTIDSPPLGQFWRPLISPLPTHSLPRSGI
jgi:hypothetical protein